MDPIIEQRKSPHTGYVDSLLIKRNRPKCPQNAKIRLENMAFSSLIGAAGGIRFSEEKPRAGKHATGMFAWTALSNPLIMQNCSTPDGMLQFWRSGWDSNPRYRCRYT